mmetsp:Transcript_24095/g.66791  ORF Transcript_24095/g.66791 Transcript_24095/m.66791 type:complete len:202 (-) Transcript_24095:644-1249(-)
MSTTLVVHIWETREVSIRKLSRRVSCDHGAPTALLVATNSNRTEAPTAVEIAELHRDAPANYVPGRAAISFTFKHPVVNQMDGGQHGSLGFHGQFWRNVDDIVIHGIGNHLRHRLPSVSRFALDNGAEHLRWIFSIQNLKGMIATKATDATDGIGLQNHQLVCVVIVRHVASALAIHYFQGWRQSCCISGGTSEKGFLDRC